MAERLSRERILDMYVEKRNTLVELERQKTEMVKLWRIIADSIEKAKADIEKIKQKMSDTDLYEAKRRSGTAG
jgi:hypothetical protein